MDFMNNILFEYSLDDIVNNLGITSIYKLKRGATAKHKKPEDYYEVICTDIGFKASDDIFISLAHEVGSAFEIGNHLDDEEFAINFKTFENLTKEYDEFNTGKFIEEYQKLVGKCYLYDFKDKDFKEITNKWFLKQRQGEKKLNIKEINITDIYNKIKETIISQDLQIREILSSIFKNQRIVNSSLDSDTIRKLKENIIVYGPTGTGKTEILFQIAKFCDVPIVIEDITSFTETGYVGRDVSDMLSDLYLAAGMDLEFAQKGILVIDEFDKLAGSDVMGGDGPSRSGVQRSLLKLLDGGTITFKEDGFDGDTISFNTSNLTVVALGAFSGIKKDKDYSDVTTDDFVKYGIINEVMGRFSKLVAMNDLKKEDYKKILLESNLSPIYIYGKLFEDLGVNFSYDDLLIDYICDEALALECGARGLKTIFDGMMSDYMFEVFAGVRKNVDLTAPKDNSHSYVLKKKAAQNRKKVGFSI